MTPVPSINHRAFSLVELLVVIAIIAIIVALVLPAVQRVRESASRAECGNHLRQIGLAAHQHHDIRKTFPPGQRFRPFNAPEPTYRYTSWLVYLLPFVEQGPLYEQTLKAYQAQRINWVDPPHAENSTIVPIYTCPSDILGTQLRKGVSFPSVTDLTAYTSYVGVMGQDLEKLTGVLFRNSDMRIADITDGTSNTLFAGERPPSLDGKFGRWAWDYGQAFDGSAGNIMGIREKNLAPVTAGACAPGYYDYAPGNFTDPCAYLHFWSAHPGGAQFLFCDGSVRFLPYSTAPIMPALASRAGNEAVATP